MRMPISQETRAALDLLKAVQAKVAATDDLKNNSQVNADLTTLITVLESPVFTSILNIQDSLRELKRQVQLHPSILPADFDITPAGELVLNVPNQSPDSGNASGTTVTTSQSQNGRGYDVNDAVKKSKPGAVGNTTVTHVNSAAPKQPEQKAETMVYDPQFREAIEIAAQGREVKYINLYKPDGSSLGFSVVGLKSEHKGELGIYVQEIQPHGIAAQDGQLLEGDQILAIDGQSLDSHISHQQAITILQRAKGTVHLVIARNFPDTPVSESKQAQPAAPATKGSSGVGAGLPSDWCQVEVIELVNTGSGLGFGIIGGQQPGVIVKTILPGGVADTDGRLRAGDFILQINEHWLQGVGSDKVANVLRGTGNHVRLIVARAVDQTSQTEKSEILPVLPSSVANSQEELETHLQIAEVANRSNSSASTPARGAVASATSAAAAAAVVGGPSTNLANDMVLPSNVSEEVSIVHNQSRSVDQTTSPMSMVPGAAVAAAATASSAASASSAVSYIHHDMPEMEQLEVELVKDSQGLGITIAGYTCEREELSGIFVKSVNEGSAAHRSGKVAVNDQIIEVDGRSIQGYTNQQGCHSVIAVMIGNIIRII